MTGSEDLQGRSGTRGRRGWVVASLALWALGAGGVLATVAPPGGFFGAYLEPVRSEFGGLLRVAWSAATGSENEVPALELRIEPRVFRAASLLHARGDDVAEADRWWFPARVRTDGRDLAVDLQLRSDPGRRPQAWRLRFHDPSGFSGIRSLDLVPAHLAEDAVETLGRETARGLDLLAPPSGFATLRLNGVDQGLYSWSERESREMFERLGVARGELLAPARSDGQGSAPPEGDESVAARQLRALFALSSTADEDDFARELPRMVDLHKLLALDALARILGRAEELERCLDRGRWYLDPVTGLLEPVAENLGGPPRVLAPTADATPGAGGALLARVLRVPAFRSARDRILGGLLGGGRDLARELADGLGRRLPQLAVAEDAWPDPRRLRELALFHRAAREALERNTAAWRAWLERAPARDAGVVRAGPTRPEASESEAWIAAAGLPFEREGDALRLPPGTYHLRRTLFVPDALALRIEPGVTLLLDPGVSLVTFRGLRAEGSEEQPIRFLPTDPEKPWGAIGVVRAPEVSTLAFVTARGGSQARPRGIDLAGQLSFNASDVVLRDSEVRDARGSEAMSVVRARFEVLRSRFAGNARDGLEATWSDGRIAASVFAENGDDGLDLAGSRVSVSATSFHGMGDKSISAGEESHLLLEDSRLVDSGVAIASKDGARVEVVGSEFRRNQLALALYRNKPLYGGGFASVTGGLLVGNARDFEVQSGSDLELHDVVREDSVAAQGGLHALRAPHALQ
jgi:hypothetical protein